MKEDFEIGIIGGGPAGSTAAAYLADYGFDVCLFEKKIFPRETLCGEFLSCEVIHFLKELDLFDDFLSLNPNRINSFRFINENGKSVCTRFTFDAYGLSRSLFDNLLLCNVKQKGITVFQPSEVKKILPLSCSYDLVIEGEGERLKINVKHLIAAYGRQSYLDDSLNRKFTGRKSKLNGIKFQLLNDQIKNFNQQEIQIYSADNIYCGVNAVDNNKVTFCFLENRNIEQPPPRKQLFELQVKNKAFRKLFNGNKYNLFDGIPVYGTGNIYFGKKEHVKKGIFMIGDSAGIIAPLAGDGIGIAMESAKLVTELFQRGKKEKYSRDQLEYFYIREWNKHFLKRIKTASVIQNFILNKYARDMGFLFVKFFTGLLPYMVKSTRNNTISTDTNFTYI